MKGVILAGGTGTRLLPLTRVANKHLLPVYDRPMIYYPIQTLIDMGCDEIIIISGGEHIGGFAELLGDGSLFGVQFTYRVQKKADGVAGALACAKGLVEGSFPVILGDNFFGSVPPVLNKPAVYLSEVRDPERFGVYSEGEIIEKPSNPSSNLAVVGLYMYDNTVFDFISELVPSERSELEITDVNNWYLRKSCEVIEYDGYWRDMGTINTLLEVANYVHNS